MKDVLAGIALGGDVVDGSGVLDSQRPGHEGVITTERKGDTRYKT